MVFFWRQKNNKVGTISSNNRTSQRRRGRKSQSLRVDADKPYCGVLVTDRALSIVLRQQQQDEQQEDHEQEQQNVSLGAMWHSMASIKLLRYSKHKRKKPKSWRSWTFQIMGVISLFQAPFMCWTALLVACNCPSPLVVVKSGGILFGPQRGDLLLIQKQHNYRVGDLVAFRVGNHSAIIVHRIVQQLVMTDSVSESKSNVRILTKGDDNRVNDRGLYQPAGEKWLAVGAILGKVSGIVRWGGVFAILLEDYPWFRIVMLVRAIQFGWRRMGKNAAKRDWLVWHVIVFNAIVLVQSDTSAFS